MSSVSDAGSQPLCPATPLGACAPSSHTCFPCAHTRAALRPLTAALTLAEAFDILFGEGVAYHDLTPLWNSGDCQHRPYDGVDLDEGGEYMTVAAQRSCSVNTSGRECSVVYR
jgi:hypothetical protein